MLEFESTFQSGESKLGLSDKRIYKCEVALKSEDLFRFMLDGHSRLTRGLDLFFSGLSDTRLSESPPSEIQQCEGTIDN